MAKKKSKDPWNVFVSGMLKRPRASRKYCLPKAYLMSVADSLWRTNASKEIIYNTLVEVATVVYEKGFHRKEEDIRFFKEKQCKHFNSEWNKEKDKIDDIIHCKNQQSK